MRDASSGCLGWVALGLEAIEARAPRRVMPRWTGERGNDHSSTRRQARQQLRSNPTAITSLRRFTQDIADIDKKRSTTNEMRETVEKHKHYMSNSRERRVGLEALYLRWSIVCTALAVYGLPPPVT